MITMPWFLEFLLMNLLFAGIFVVGYVFLRTSQTNAQGRFLYLKIVILSLPWLGLTPQWQTSPLRPTHTGGTIAWLTSPATSATSSTQSALHWETLLTIGIAVYLVISAIRVGKVLRGIVLVKRIAAAAQPVPQLGDNVFVHSEELPSGLLGIIKPRICLSERSLREFSQSECETILIHERIHVERRDPLFHTWALLTKAFFFLNPFASWLVARFLEDMELSSDECVLLKQRLSVRSYAELLAKASELESNKANTAWSGVYISQTFVIRRLLAMKKNLRTKTAAVMSTLVGTIALSAFAASSVGQTQDTVGPSSAKSCRAIEFSLTSGPFPGTWSCGDFVEASVPKPCDTKNCYLSLTMTQEAAKRFEQTTGANIGKKIVMKINGRVFAEPVIREAILGKSQMLSGDFSEAEQTEVVNAVRAAQSNR